MVRYTIGGLSQSNFPFLLEHHGILFLQLEGEEHVFLRGVSVFWMGLALDLVSLPLQLRVGYNYTSIIPFPCQITNMALLCPPEYKVSGYCSFMRKGTVFSVSPSKLCFLWRKDLPNEHNAPMWIFFLNVQDNFFVLFSNGWSSPLRTWSTCSSAMVTVSQLWFARSPVTDRIRPHPTLSLRPGPTSRSSPRSTTLRSSPVWGGGGNVN